MQAKKKLGNFRHGNLVLLLNFIPLIQQVIAHYYSWTLTQNRSDVEAKFMKIFFLLFLPISTILAYLVENMCVYKWLNGKADKCWNYVQIKRRLMSLRVGGCLWYFLDEVPNENVARHHWINLFIGTALSHADRETERPSDKQGTDKSNSCIVYMYFAKAMKSARTFLIDSSSSYYMLLRWPVWWMWILFWKRRERLKPRTFCCS